MMKVNMTRYVFVLTVDIMCAIQRDNAKKEPEF